MRLLNKKAFSVIEYAVLIVIIIGAFLVMRNNIQRGIFGMWGNSGQSFAFGRQYDSQKTVECSFDEQSNLWYDRNCFESLNNQECSIGDTACQESIMSGACQTSSCSAVSN